MEINNNQKRVECIFHQTEVVIGLNKDLKL